MIGVAFRDPAGRWTLRDLAIAAEARTRAAWDHTARVLQLLADAHFPKGAPHPLARFHPFAPKPEKERFAPSDLRAIVAQRFRDAGQEPPPELLAEGG